MRFNDGRNSAIFFHFRWHRHTWAMVGQQWRRYGPLQRIMNHHCRWHNKSDLDLFIAHSLYDYGSPLHEMRNIVDDHSTENYYCHISHRFAPHLAHNRIHFVRTHSIDDRRETRVHFTIDRSLTRHHPNFHSMTKVSQRKCIRAPNWVRVCVCVWVCVRIKSLNDFSQCQFSPLLVSM